MATSSGVKEISLEMRGKLDKKRDNSSEKDGVKNLILNS